MVRVGQPPKNSYVFMCVCVSRVGTSKVKVHYFDCLKSMALSLVHFKGSPLKTPVPVVLTVKVVPRSRGMTRLKGKRYLPKDNGAETVDNAQIDRTTMGPVSGGG